MKTSLAKHEKGRKSLKMYLQKAGVQSAISAKHERNEDKPSDVSIRIADTLNILIDYYEGKTLFELN